MPCFGASSTGSERVEGGFAPENNVDKWDGDEKDSHNDDGDDGANGETTCMGWTSSYVASAV